MQNKYPAEMINSVHYCLLKRRSFEEICEVLTISSEELLNFINQINLLNNQVIPIIYLGDQPKILYHKIEYKIHRFDYFKKKLKLMVVSDKHIDHLDDSFSYIHDVYEEAERRRVDYVFDLGDILNGPVNRVHNPQKVRTGTLEGSIQQLKKNHPKNMTTYFVSGNHDLKFMESEGCDIGRLIESECGNMKFLNNLFTCISIGDLRINLSHGSLENKLLSKINLNKEFKFLRTNKPHIICQGHFHMSFIPDCLSPLLCQVPSLKFSHNNNYLNKKSPEKDMGVVFLTITETSNEYEIEQETVEFIQSRKLVKRELFVNK